MFSFPSRTAITALVKTNWQSGITVALISVPLSIALSIASGAGPLPGLITGIWGTLIGSLFIGSHYNIVGAAGALTTILFAATLAAPFGLGAATLPLLAIVVGSIIFAIWLLKLDRFLYFIPSSVMYGFAAGVAVLIAASQLFDATGLSALKRTGHFVGDIEKFIENSALVHLPSVLVFGAFLVSILIWKRFIKKVPAVIPAALIGIVFGAVEASRLGWGLTSLQDKFGEFSATVWLPVAWDAFPRLLGDTEAIAWLFSVGGTIALIAVLETLITAKLGDKLTKTESSSSRELFGLSLANLGSGLMGGLPATGVFIRTGANIKAGATHRTSGIIAAISTAVIALAALPFFSYLPMPVIAAILVNTALGLLETDKFVEFWKHEKESFAVAVLVAGITIFHDAGLGVTIGAVAALLIFASRVAHGRFDIIWNYDDGTNDVVHNGRHLIFPKTDKQIIVATYSIAGNLGYIDAVRHLNNLKRLAHSDRVPAVIIRLRNLYSVDFEGAEALSETVAELTRRGKNVAISSPSQEVAAELCSFPAIAALKADNKVYAKAGEAFLALTKAP